MRQEETVCKWGRSKEQGPPGLKGRSGSSAAGSQLLFFTGRHCKVSIFLTGRELVPVTSPGTSHHQPSLGKLTFPLDFQRLKEEVVGVKLVLQKKTLYD